MACLFVAGFTPQICPNLLVCLPAAGQPAVFLYNPMLYLQMPTHRSQGEVTAVNLDSFLKKQKKNSRIRTRAELGLIGFEIGFVLPEGENVVHLHIPL